MSEAEVFGTLTQLFTFLTNKAGVQEQIDQATHQLLEFCKAPNSVLAFVHYILNSTNYVFTSHAIIYLRKNLVKHNEIIPLEIQASSFQQLAAMIPKIPDERARRLLAESLIHFRIDPTGTAVYVQITQLAMQYIQNENLLSVGLYLFNEIINTVDNSEAIIPQLVPNVITCLTNQNPTIRIAAMELLTTILSPVMAFYSNDSFLMRRQFFENDARLLEICPALAMQSLTNQNEDESYQFFIMLELFLKLDSFLPLLSSFGGLILQALSNKEFSYMSRVHTIDALISIVYQGFDELGDQFLGSAFQAIFELAIEATGEMDFNPDNNFVTDMLRMIADTLESDEFYDTFYPYMTALFQSGTEGGIEIGLVILSELVAYSGESIAEDINSLVQTVGNAIASDSENLCHSGCVVIASICESFPEDLAPFADLLFPHLLQHTTFLPALNALDTLFRSIDVPPDNLQDIVTQLINTLQVISPDMQDRVIDVLNSSFNHLQLIDESYYGAISPVLFQLIQCGNPQQQASSICCMNTLLTMAPQSLQRDLNQLMSLMQLFSVGDFSLNTALCEFIDNLASIYPNVLVGQIAQFVQAVNNLIAMPEDSIEDDDDEDEEEDDDREDFKYTEMKRMKASAVTTLCRLCRYLPQQMQPHFQQVYAILRERIGASTTLDGVCITLTGLGELAAGYAALNLSIDPFFQDCIKEINEKSKEVDYLAPCIKAICKLIRLGGQQLAAENFDAMGAFILPIFKRESVFANKGNKKEIAENLQGPIFKLVRLLLQLLGERCEPLVQELLPILQEFMQLVKRDICGKACVLLAQIAASVPAHQNLLEPAVAFACNLLQRNKISFQMEAMDTLIIAIHANPAALAPIVQQINQPFREMINPIFEGQKASFKLIARTLSLWLSISAVYHAEISQEELSRANDLVFNSNSPYLKYYAEFVQDCVARGIPNAQSLLFSVAISTLSSEPYYWRDINKQTLLMFCDAVQSASPQDIEAALNSQFLIAFMQNNIQIIRQP